MYTNNIKLQQAQYSICEFISSLPVDDGVGQGDPGILECRDGELDPGLVGVQRGPHRHHGLVVLHPPVPLGHRHLGVLRGAGGHHHVAPGVGEVLAQAAVVPAAGRGLVRAGRGGMQRVFSGT